MPQFGPEPTVETAVRPRVERKRSELGEETSPRASRPSKGTLTKTLEEDLGNPSLLQVLLILTILILTIPIAFVIDWLKKLYGYFKNFPSCRNNHIEIDYANK